MRAAAGAISRARTRARAHIEIVADGLELGELKCGQRCVLLNLTHAWPRASSAKERLGAMRAAAGATSRARARARAHDENAGDGRELGELQGGQLSVLLNLTHAWQRAGSAAGQARRDACGGGRDQPSAGEGARAHRDFGRWS